MKIGDGQKILKQKILRPSEVRLKVRNIDEKQVTNDDLKVSKLKLFNIYSIRNYSKKLVNLECVDLIEMSLDNSLDQQQ